MACSLEMKRLIDAVLDEEATAEEQQKLKTHMHDCRHCRQHYNQLVQSINLLKGLEQPNVSEHFTASVLSVVPIREKGQTLKRWFKPHPVLTAAAVFIILMISSFFSLWQFTPFQAVVKGKGRLAYQGNTVIVPKDEVIDGDLIVKNGNAKIEGKVKGDVVLIQSHSLLASAGHVNGKIEKINKFMEWLWYDMKGFFTRVFLIKRLPG
ncbi:anti-sigma factor RsiW [Scopulibacillus daqui]|uniref:Anti-sigma factor RsiW n=1 Tax=Scopulibacillus daqui TaxID=1469162 RepID=A0ABS2PWS6_9BACL|nr:zf-HC2 domain-containing protein [Scopulibacillus daqui]MBM7644493.1 anti-sigma factor RsiW [Scopulibacillus daqui]